MKKVLRQQLKEYNGEDRIISSRKMEKVLSRTNVSIISVRSEIQSLDASTDGFQEGEVVVISGPPKSGKTLLAQTFTVNFIEQGRASLWFSYEVPTHQFLSQFPFSVKFYMPRRLKPHDLGWLMERTRECKAKNGTRIVFIDHLHYLIDMSRTNNASLEIGAIIRHLKILAVKERLIIFLLAHMTKGKSQTISHEDIRDSSFIAQESDSVLMIQRTPQIAQNAARLQVELHRRTGVMRKSIELVKYKGLLVERNQFSPNSGKRPLRTDKGRANVDREKSGERQGDDKKAAEDQ